MKMHSDNIKATAGVLAIHNLNVFPSSGGSMDYTVPWQDSFREACRRAAILAAEAVADRAEGSFGDDKATLLELSIPRFEVLGEGRYRLTGGLFLWVTLPEFIDATELLKKAIEHKVAYVPGDAFHPHGDGRNSLRLNFSYCNPEKITTGIQRLGDVMREAIEEHAADMVLQPAL